MNSSNKNDKSEVVQSQNRKPSGFFRSSGSRRMSLNCVSRKSKSGADTASADKARSSIGEDCIITKTATTTSTTPITTSTTTTTTPAVAINSKTTEQSTELATTTTTNAPTSAQVRTEIEKITTPASSLPVSATTTPVTPIHTKTILSSSRHEASATTIRNITATETTSRQAINMKTNILPSATKTTPIVVRTMPGRATAMSSIAGTAAASKKPTISTIEQEFAKLIKARDSKANSDGNCNNKNNKNKYKSKHPNVCLSEENNGKMYRVGENRSPSDSSKSLFLSAPRTAVNCASVATTKTVLTTTTTTPPKILRSPVKVIITAADSSTDDNYANRPSLPSGPISHVQPFSKVRCKSNMS
ncbi:uncharacterized protein LOC128861094 [Anastrepha ludens]|uniref:uncharacterized protein LOC128861094 n=1 Tax=Anastrepha ludens TaxID=28586 RepID=UPI0023B0FAAE|nr:uncharacterized protein LOC128861094 [Anastrepha ludens]